MNLNQLMQQIREKGILLRVDGDRLRYDAPKGVMTDELLSELARHKSSIMADLGEEFQSSAADAEVIPRVERNRRFYPASFEQKRMWFLHQLLPDLPVYHMGGAYKIDGDMAIKHLEQAIEALLKRHESLRTVFRLHDGEPCQCLLEPEPFELKSYDLASIQDPSGPNVNELITSISSRPFDLSRDRLIRIEMIHAGENEDYIILILHHIISDGWSMNILFRELLLLYLGFHHDEPASLPDLPINYIDYAEWQQKSYAAGRLDHELAYWKENLKGQLPILNLPADHRGESEQTKRGSCEPISLPGDLTRHLTLLGRSENATMFMTLLAAYMVLLHRLSGQDDIIIGSPIAGRGHTGVENIIGLFVNSIVVRGDMSSDPEFRVFLRTIRDACLHAYSNQDLPFEKLVDELVIERNPNANPVFQTMFAFHDSTESMESQTSLNLKPVETSLDRAQFELCFSLNEYEGKLLGIFQYQTDIFEKATIQRWIKLFQNLLLEIINDPDQRIGRIPLLDGEDRDRILVQWNNTRADYPREATIVNLFEEQAVRHPDKTAVSSGGSSVTYDQLNRRANRLAHYLSGRGMKQKMLMGVCQERGIDMLISVLGVMKAGCAYVPIDSGFPVQRIAMMIEDSGLHALLTTSDLAEILFAGRDDLILTDLQSPVISKSLDSNPQTRPDPQDVAYIIYTSGSTGRPKGVQIPHRGLTNFLCSMANEPGLHEQDVLLAVTTLSFDISGLELYLPLIRGACVVIAEHDTAVDASALSDLIEDSGATVMQSTPATWLMLQQVGWKGKPRLKALCGGEAMPVELARWLKSCCGEVWNLYGPTETTIWSTVLKIEEIKHTIPIGRPIANTQVYILYTNMNPVPPGVAGDLYIAGDGVAIGYLNRPELTAERFVDNPFTTLPDSKMYFTGDQARWLSDGNIEFLGRNDYQVKLRGFRIELGEIESVISRHEQISQAVVVIREDQPGDQRLTAYMIAEGEINPATAELRESLSTDLPYYMVPSQFVFLGSMPLTPNGKVDRKALPTPTEMSMGLAIDYVEPSTDMEIYLGKIWAEVLGVERVGVNDNFFDLGGHSMLVIRVISRLKDDHDMQINPREFMMQSLGQIAQLCENELAPAYPDHSQKKLGEEPAPEKVGRDAAPVQPVLEPFFFGPPNRQLFGCYHRPPPERLKDMCVLLCYPVGHEYIRCHRALRQLAFGLSAQGYPILRFDYFGTGDSAGMMDEAAMAEWVRNVGDAIAQLRGRAGSRSVAVIGLRLGANLAMSACQQCGDVDMMVLWDPVQNGDKYILEKTAQHEKHELDHDNERTGHLESPGNGREILGYHYAGALLEEIRSCNLQDDIKRPARQVLMINTVDKEGVNGHEPAWIKGLQFQGPRIWMAEPYEAVVPIEALKYIMSWIIRNST
jgi:amino acid adenylation domain-containing protein